MVIPPLQVNDKPPFLVDISTINSSLDHEVRVGIGYVIEKKGELANPPIIPRLPYLMIQETDDIPSRITAGDSIPYAIEINQYVCVSVSVLPDGSIGHATDTEDEWVKIEIRDDYNSDLPINDTYESSGTPGVIRYPLARAVLDATTDLGSILKIEPIMAGSHIFHTFNFEDEETKHPWKVEMGDDGEIEGEKIWRYIGDSVYTQGGPIAVADGSVEGGAGFVVLKITRDESSREATAAVVEFSSTAPTSDYTDQYRILAEVDPEGNPPVFQKQFEEIRIEEDLIIVNGEGYYAGFEMSHRNFYDLPT